MLIVTVASPYRSSVLELSWTTRGETKLWLLQLEVLQDRIAIIQLN